MDRTHVIQTSFSILQQVSVIHFVFWIMFLAGVLGCEATAFFFWNVKCTIWITRWDFCNSIMELQSPLSSTTYDISKKKAWSPLVFGYHKWVDWWSCQLWSWLCNFFFKNMIYWNLIKMNDIQSFWETFLESEKKKKRKKRKREKRWKVSSVLRFVLTIKKLVILTRLSTS